MYLFVKYKYNIKTLNNSYGFYQIQLRSSYNMGSRSKYSTIAKHMQYEHLIKVFSYHYTIDCDIRKKEN